MSSIFELREVTGIILPVAFALLLLTSNFAGAWDILWFMNLDENFMKLDENCFCVLRQANSCGASDFSLCSE